MKDSLRQRFERLAMRLAELDATLADPNVTNDMNRYRQLAREQAEASEVVQLYREYQQRESDLAGAKGLLADPDMADMARDEIASAEADIAQLDARLQLMLLPRDPDDARNAFLEIRAGTGGDESALFAGDLARMYLRYVEREGWRAEVMSESASELGGYKEIVLRIESTVPPGGKPPPLAGDKEAWGRPGASLGAYGRLRFESGGHRVQRVPATEAQGRIHTSACTVAVLPEPDEAAEVTLNPADLRIDTFRASGAGGQHVNKTDSAIRITHIPTGLVAECQDDRSQHRNKAKAMAVLAARLRDNERTEREAKEAATRKSLVGSGDRSDRIRTYNFPQGRLTDHRINLTLYKLQAVIDGDLDEVIQALQAARAAEQLAALEEGGAA
jgi:peptide chain release factor 1